MSDIKRYFPLDDIGFLGSSTSGKSEAEIREDIRWTDEYIKNLKAGKKPGRRAPKKVRKKG
jgi:hypothetical protein